MNILKPDSAGKPSAVRVLVADDDPIFTQIASAFLRQGGYTPTVVGDGAMAIEALTDGAYQLALVDLSMPRISGFRLISLIRSTPRIATLPIIVLTVRSDHEAIKEAHRIGANGYMTKPVDWRELTKLMRSLVDGRKCCGSESVG
ncbi:MAG: response regulator [Hyphomicrobiaceae bacterium]